MKKEDIILKLKKQDAGRLLFSYIPEGVEKEGDEAFAEGQISAELKDGKLVNSGGRVLGVTSVADTLENAIAASYNKVEKIHFGNAYCRKDIGQRALKAINK